MKNARTLETKISNRKNLIASQPDNDNAYGLMADDLVELAKLTKNADYIKQAFEAYGKAINLSGHQNPLYLAARAKLYVQVNALDFAIEDVITAIGLDKIDGTIGRHIDSTIKKVIEYCNGKIEELVKTEQVSQQVADSLIALTKDDFNFAAIENIGNNAKQVSDATTIAWLVSKVTQIDKNTQVTNEQMTLIQERATKLEVNFAAMNESLKLLSNLTIKVEQVVEVNKANEAKQQEMQSALLSLKQNVREVIAKVGKHDTIIEEINSEITGLLQEGNFNADSFFELNKAIKEINERLEIQQAEIAGIDDKMSKLQEQLNSDKEQLTAELLKQQQTIARIKAIEPQIEQAEASGDSTPMLENLFKEQQELKSGLEAQSKTVEAYVHKIVELEKTLVSTGIQEQMHLLQEFNELKQTDETLYKYATTFYSELVNYLRTYQMLGTGLIQGNNLNDILDKSNYGNIKGLIGSLGKAGFEIVYGIIDNYTISGLSSGLVSIAEDIKDAKEQAEVSNQVTKVKRIIDGKLLTPDGDLNLEALKKIALRIVEIRKTKIKNDITDQFDEKEEKSAIEKVAGHIDSALGHIKNKLMPVIARYNSTEEQFAANDALMLLGMLCSRYEQVTRLKINIEDFIDAWRIKEIEVYSKIQEPLEKIEKAAKDGNWEASGNVGSAIIKAITHKEVNKNIEGRLTEEYLKEKLGSMYNTENTEIAKMLYFAMISKGVRESNNRDLGCARKFKEKCPDIIDKIAREHPEYFLGNKQVIELCVAKPQIPAIVQKIEDAGIIVAAFTETKYSNPVAQNMQALLGIGSKYGTKVASLLLDLGEPINPDSEYSTAITGDIHDAI